MPDPKQTNQRIDSALKWLFLIGAGASLLFGIVLVGIGLFWNFRAVFHFLRDAAPLGTSQKFLGEILSGFELMLIAPLCFLVFVGIWKLVAEACERDLQKITAPDSNFHCAKALLENIKELIIGLIFAVIATHLLDRIIQGKSTSANELYVVAAAVVTLFCFYFLLKGHSGKK